MDSFSVRLTLPESLGFWRLYLTVLLELKLLDRYGWSLPSNPKSSFGWWSGKNWGWFEYSSSPFTDFMLWLNYDICPFLWLLMMFYEITRAMSLISSSCPFSSKAFTSRDCFFGFRWLACWLLGGFWCWVLVLLLEYCPAILLQELSSFGIVRPPVFKSFWLTEEVP